MASRTGVIYFGSMLASSNDSIAFFKAGKALMSPLFAKASAILPSGSA